MLSDINRNLDDISLESKVSEREPMELEPRVEQILASLYDRIKYQEIEIAMLKKQRFDVARSEA